MKKISCWKDLNDAKIGVFELDVEETKEDKRDYRMSIVSLKITNTLHDVTFDTTFYRKNLDIAVETLKGFGFDLEYEVPFNLVEFLKEILCKKTFKDGESNYYFTISKNEIRLRYGNNDQIIGVPYLGSKVINVRFIIEKKFIEERVTKVQLIGALEELGWV